MLLTHPEIERHHLHGTGSVVRRARRRGTLRAAVVAPDDDGNAGLHEMAAAADLALLQRLADALDASLLCFHVNAPTAAMLIAHDACDLAVGALSEHPRPPLHCVCLPALPTGVYGKRVCWLPAHDIGWRHTLLLALWRHWSAYAWKLLWRELPHRKDAQLRRRV